jgi:hypothetical protein
LVGWLVGWLVSLQRLAHTRADGLFARLAVACYDMQFTQSEAEWKANRKVDDTQRQSYARLGNHHTFHSTCAFRSLLS